MKVEKIEDIEQELEQIERFLQQPLPADVNALVEHGHKVYAVLARSGELLADAKYHRDNDEARAIIANLAKDAGCPPSILKKLVESSCARQNHLVNGLDNAYRAAIHLIDWSRTVISKEKAEMALSSGISNTWRP
jgi:hypothetical protein